MATSADQLDGAELCAIQAIRRIDAAASFRGEADDTLLGGLGIDGLLFDSPAAVVIEAASEGTDRVFAPFSCTLASGRGYLTLSGMVPVNGTGNAAGTLLAGAASIGDEGRARWDGRCLRGPRVTVPLRSSQGAAQRVTRTMPFGSAAAPPDASICQAACRHGRLA